MQKDLQTSNSLYQNNRQLFIDILQELANNPTLANEDDQAKSLITKIHKTARKSKRAQSQAFNKWLDSEKKASTLLYQLNDERKIGQLIQRNNTEESSLIKPQSCYCCKALYHQLHFFYHQLCPECAEINYRHRNQSCNLEGRTALVTGGRIKIGYEVALRLLRFGANVVVTTRFPSDAIEKFSAEPDHSDWSNRLTVYGLDLRNVPSVEQFIQHLSASLPALDIIINNAAQTIKRPLEFYKHLLEKEKSTYILEANNQYLPTINNLFFPKGQRDMYGQQLDLRTNNSWIMPLDKVSLMEMLEVQLVNVTAPFLINSKLKPLLIKSSFERKFIVNVSAMEGKFNREYKTPYHPHTNMAKAALNMMTRTSAQDYEQDGIYMTSVDTGWITDENPAPKRARMRDNGFVPPLDVVDGAARVLDPIVKGITDENTPYYGIFLKDYKITTW